MFSIGEGAPTQSEGVLEGSNVGQQQSDSDKLARANEIAWLQVATLAEQSNDLAKAADAYNHVLLTNSRNVHALLQLASISRMQERFEDAVEYLNRIMAIDGPTGEVYGAIGHCYLTLSQRTQDLDMTLDCLRKCYDAYHEASLHLGALNDPNLWYGIGLLYERYANLMLPGVGQGECFSAAEESLRSVLQAAPGFEKRSEILYRYATLELRLRARDRARARHRAHAARAHASACSPSPRLAFPTRGASSIPLTLGASSARSLLASPLAGSVTLPAALSLFPSLSVRLCVPGPRRRLGHIYKAQENPHRALECFQAICDAPPPPLTQADVWFLIGSVQETMEPPAPEFARQAYVHVLRLMQLNEEAKVARVYRQLGWVCHKFALDQPPLLGILNPAEAQAQSPLLCLKRALETEPMDAPNWQVLGACLLDHRELDAAYDCLRHAITLEPTSDKAWRSVGDLYLAQGEREDAIQAYEQTVHLNPCSPAWFDLGAARHDALTVSGAGATSMITAAVEAYTRALTICPNRREDISRRLQHLNTISLNTSMPPVSAADAGCAAKTAKTAPAGAASDEGPSILHAAAVQMAAVADGGAPATAAASLSRRRNSLRLGSPVSESWLDIRAISSRRC